MTSPQVSEDEVEAAALANKRFETGRTDIHLDPPDSPGGKFERDRARAALTAAAQVRGKGGEPAASLQQVRDLDDYTESVARALHEAHMPYCDYTYPFEDPMSSADMYRTLARAVTRVSPSAEPDSGPDVTGIPRGEE